MRLRLQIGHIGQAGDGKQNKDDAEDGSAYLHYEFPVITWPMWFQRQMEVLRAAVSLTAANQPNNYLPSGSL
ncbi:MAG TPA: hypothetical protein VLE50_04595 [Cellvibrio sp.]|nr:hypothetical protein [Cellvibrio sp.]